MIHREPDLILNNLHGNHCYHFHIHGSKPDEFDLWEHEFSEAIINYLLHNDGIYQTAHPISFDGRFVSLSHIMVSLHTKSLNRDMEVTPEEFWKILVDTKVRKR